MSRDVEQYNIQHSQDDHVNRVTLAKCTFENGTVRVHDGMGVIRLENLLINSEDFSSWSGTPTVTPNAATAPDGSSTADLLDDDDAAVNESITQTVTVPNNSDTYTFSVYLKEGSAVDTQVKIQITGGTGVSNDPVISWSGGVASIDGGETATRKLTDIGSGWYRLDVTTSNNSTGNTSLTCIIWPARYHATGATTGTVYAWGAVCNTQAQFTGYHQTTTEAKYAEEFIGIGAIGTVSSVRVTPDLRPIPVTLNLSGVPNSVLYEATTGNHYGLDVMLYSCFTDDNGKPLTTPALDWEGYLDTISVELGESSGNMTVTAESRLSFWDKANLRRYTDVDQQNEYSGDKFFEYLPQMFELELQWGGKNLSTGGGASAGRAAGGPLVNWRNVQGDEFVREFVDQYRD